MNLIDVRCYSSKIYERSDLRCDERGPCLLVLRAHEEGETRGEEEEAHEREGLRDVSEVTPSGHECHSR